jgi:hypothetical protein
MNLHEYRAKQILAYKASEVVELQETADLVNQVLK